MLWGWGVGEASATLRLKGCFAMARSSPASSIIPSKASGGYAVPGRARAGQADPSVDARRPTTTRSAADCRPPLPTDWHDWSASAQPGS